MKCPKCGAENQASAERCAECGARLSEQPFKIPNYLLPAILVTVFCCQPPGIVAIVLSAIAMGRRAEGSYERAYDAADAARVWCWIAFWLGFIPAAIVFIFGTGVFGAFSGG